MIGVYLVANELRGVELRLERAHEHADALKHESRMFMMELPQAYGIVLDDEPILGEYIVRGQIRHRPPVRLGILAIDAAHNLRAALDMIAWELALKGPSPPPDDDHTTGFPICTKPKAWESRKTNRMIERIPDAAINVIKSFQPYNRPGRPPRLQVIQALDNWGKHKAIPALLSFYVSQFTILNDGFEIISVNEKAFDDGDEIGRVRRIGPNPDEKFAAGAMCHVGFSRSGPGFGWPIDFFDNAYREIRDEILPAFQQFFPD